VFQKRKYIRDEKHRRFIASLPCIITGKSDVQCAHIRKGNHGGAGLKPSDEYCVPLCVSQHSYQGDIGEVAFWYPYGGYIRASELALELYACTGNREKALEVIARWKASI
jgi:hypothetical protein